MKPKGNWRGLTLATIVLAAAPAMAQAPGAAHGLPGRSGDVKAARDALKEAHKEARAALKDKDASAEDRKEALEALKKAREELRATRQARRKERLEELQKKYDSDFLGKAAVVAERRIHARRMARLSVMLKLAKEMKKDALVTRIEAAKKKEQERHEKRMEKLKSTNGVDTAAPAASAPKGAK
jgi:hypothetical protein